MKNLIKAIANGIITALVFVGIPWCIYQLMGGIGLVSCVVFYFGFFAYYDTIEK